MLLSSYRNQIVRECHLPTSQSPGLPQIRFDGGPGANKDQFKYFDEEGEASNTLTLNLTEAMNLKTYNCSVEIEGSDSDRPLTSEGLLVVQCKRYF